MADVNELLNEAQEILEDVFTDVTQEGINFAARETVRRQIYTRVSSANPLKPAERDLFAEDILTVMDLNIGQIKEWRGGSLAIVGDAKIEVSQYLWTRDTLLGKDLEIDQELIYKIGEETYTIASGGISDPDGLTWQITLTREAQNSV